jgi:hypothetical protein
MLPIPHSTQTPVDLTATAGEPLHSHQKAGAPAPSLRGEKRQLARMLQRIIYPPYPSLRNTAEAPREKGLKTSPIVAREIKAITKTNSRCINLKTERKRPLLSIKVQFHHQGSKHVLRGRAVKKKNEFQKTIGKMINDLKEETQK